MPSLPEAAPLDNPLFRALVCQVKALARSLIGPDAPFAEVEVACLQIANWAVGCSLTQHLQALSDSLGKELLVDGVLYRQHEEGKVPYHSLTADLPVRRFSYREVGVRNGPTVIPLELAAGLVEYATPALSYSVMLGYAQGELRGYLESMAAAHRQLPSRSTVERLAKAIGQEAQRAAPRIEANLRQTEHLPEGAHGISIGLDRVAAPMEEDRPEGAEPKTRRKERTEPYQRAKPAPVDVNYRMVYVGTASVVDAHGKELVTRRYTALADQEPDVVVKKLMADLHNVLGQDPKLKVGVNQDGAVELWQAMERGLKAEGVTKWVETIDRYHLEERLGEALLLVEPRAEVRKKQMKAWIDDLDESDQAIDRIEQWLGGHIDKVKDEKEVEEYLDHLVYIQNNKHRMRYRRVIEAGLPVGSGTTEGACKSVVGQRANGTSQRWRPVGIGSALTLRAIHRSERLPGFWRLLARRYTAEIAEAA